MHIVNMNRVEKSTLDGSHGALTQFQRILGRGTTTPDLMRSFTGVSRITVPPGESNNPHLHESEEQIYIILRGRGLAEVGDEIHDAKAGDVIYLPPGVKHGFHNNSAITTVILNIGSMIQPERE